MSMEMDSSADMVDDSVTTVFGERSDTATTNTCGMGVLDQHQILFVVKQGGPVTKEDIAVMTLGTKFGKVVDVRELVSTRRRKGEWSGYHAEAMLVSGILGYFGIDARTQSLSQAKTLFSSHGGGPTTICANAPCCYHCANLLDALGIGYANASGKHGLTGWWNPFTDGVFGNGAEGFSAKIPGST